VVAVAITFGAKFKISLHAAVASAAVVVLALTYGPWALLLAVLVAWVAWSRVALRDHTTPEVLAGLLMGVVVGGGGYWALLTALT
jgi:membrane-associated phospholipid phosphatase